MVQDPLKVPRRPLYKGSKRKSSKARIYFQDRIDSEIIKAFRRKSEVASPCPLTASKKEVPRYTFAPVIGSCKLVWGGGTHEKRVDGQKRACEDKLSDKLSSTLHQSLYWLGHRPSRSWPALGKLHWLKHGVWHASSSSGAGASLPKTN